MRPGSLPSQATPARVARAFHLASTQIVAVASEGPGRPSDPGLAEAFALVGTRSVIFRPPRARGRTLGTISFVDGEGGAAGPSREQVALSERVALHAALAIDTARLLPAR